MIHHQFTRAPHVEGAGTVLSPATNAALLIDFDNVTMGIRSDLSKEIKALLNSDIIKGKVTVQRAYADWRRYPQYIVPLSEASVDLIFAPAYGSSKKNATDIRMAIDGMELVFIRPEIGTYILLTGDSDFSSLVLKLKEYGKYVIGVGIQESSSDILVQNCDEYYSYSSLTGLQRTSSGAKGKSADPWALVSEASRKMVKRGDVMRSDRLKQVMLELDPGFEESKHGFSKFSKFLAEAASRGLLRLHKLENGQHEVIPSDARARGAVPERPVPQPPGARRHSAESGEERGRKVAARGGKGAGGERVSGNGTKGADTFEDAYALLRKALPEVSPDNGWTRDSDLKRCMLDLDDSFDEAGLGFSKFSKFLTQAHEHEVVRIRRNEKGNFVVRLPRSDRVRAQDAARSGSRRESAPRAEPTATVPSSEPLVAKKTGRTPRSPRLRMRSQSQRARERDREESAAGSERLKEEFAAKGERPKEEFAAKGERPKGEPAAKGERPKGEPAAKGERPKGEPAAKGERPETKPAFDPARIGLPTDPSAVQRYLANRYRGVGEKTAGRLIETFGGRIFHVLHDSIEKLEGVVPRNRIAQIEEAWREDFARRSKADAAQERTGAPRAAAPARRTRLGRRRGSS